MLPLYPCTPDVDRMAWWWAAAALLLFDGNGCDELRLTSIKDGSDDMGKGVAGGNWGGCTTYILDYSLRG